MKIRLLIISILVLSGCAGHTPPTQAPQPSWLPPAENAKLTDLHRLASDNWSIFTEDAAHHYGVDQRLIAAIINVESGGNPNVVSRSNAIGLMQIKASTAGREVYQLRGRNGQPSKSELKNPANNIDIGTAYIQHLQNTALLGIRNPVTLRYATIVAYANGAGALLRTFSDNREQAIALINKLTPTEFCRYIALNHPAGQAPRYLWKVNTAYQNS